MSKSECGKELMTEFQAKIRDEYSPRYFDRQGQELQLMEWVLKSEDMNYKIVKEDRIGKYFVSTVWIGLDMKLFRHNPPLIFETIIFVKEYKENEDFYLERYSTEQEALIGHEKAISLVKNRIASVN